MNKNERTEAHVRAVNMANAAAIELYPKLAELFRPLVGTKIEKVDGTLLAKIAMTLPEFPCTPALHVYKHTSNYSLAWSVKTCVSIPGYCVYYEATVYVGNMRNGVLTELSKPFSARTDYTADEVIQKRDVYEKAKQAADDARSDLFPFGERD